MRTIVWVGKAAEPEAGAEVNPAHASAQLAALGFQVIACQPASSFEIEAELRVIEATGFADLHHLRLEYGMDAKPALILVESDRQEIEVLDFVEESDDVARSDAPAKLLACKLTRLAVRANSAALLSALQRQDPLTGLFSERFFNHFLEPLLEELLPRGSAALLTFDLDNFKQVNDTFGRDGGDRMLQELAHLLQSQAAREDRIARLGPNEFAYLLCRYDRETVQSDVRKILQLISEHEFLAADEGHGHGVFATTSAGLAFVQLQPGPEALRREAEMAMYQAKGSGRNQLVMFGDIEQAGDAGSQDLQLRHLETVARVMSERAGNLISLMGQLLVGGAQREAYVDPLTQLNNRLYFDARIGRELAAAKKHGRALTIAILDLDHFHQINQTFGREGGDKILKRLAEIVTLNIRLVDWAARYSGDQFCLVMPDTDFEMGVKVVERITRKLKANPVEAADGKPLPVGLSFGMAEYSAAVQVPEDLTQQAGEALLAAKKNRI